jgi:hypothetical protein
MNPVMHHIFFCDGILLWAITYEASSAGVIHSFFIDRSQKSEKKQTVLRWHKRDAIHQKQDAQEDTTLSETVPYPSVLDNGACDLPLCPHRCVPVADRSPSEYSS